MSSDEIYEDVEKTVEEILSDKEEEIRYAIRINILLGIIVYWTWYISDVVLLKVSDSYWNYLPSLFGLSLIIFQGTRTILTFKEHDMKNYWRSSLSIIFSTVTVLFVFLGSSAYKLIGTNTLNSLLGGIIAAIALVILKHEIKNLKNIFLNEAADFKIRKGRLRSNRRAWKIYGNAFAACFLVHFYIVISTLLQIFLEPEFCTNSLQSKPSSRQ